MSHHCHHKKASRKWHLKSFLKRRKLWQFSCSIVWDKINIWKLTISKRSPKLLLCFCRLTVSNSYLQRNERENPLDHEVCNNIFFLCVIYVNSRFSHTLPQIFAPFQSAFKEKCGKGKTVDYECYLFVCFSDIFAIYTMTWWFFFSHS